MVGLLCYNSMFIVDLLILTAFLSLIALSHSVLMLIFRFSTYHKYFFWTLPLLIIYGFAVASLNNALGLNDYFPYFILIVIALLLNRLVSNKKKTVEFLQTINDENKEKADRSIALTEKYYNLSSLAYVASIFISFMILLNI